MTVNRDQGRRWRCVRDQRENLLAHAGAWLGAGLLLAVALHAQTDWVRVRVLEPRSDVPMAYDAARQRIVLFGGRIDSGVAPLGQTWEWDGSSWSLQNPAASPPPRHSHALAYDAARQRIVLFGGSGVS